MARRALTGATLRVVQAVTPIARPGVGWLVAVSGGPDSLALAFAAHYHAARVDDISLAAVVIDHQLQPGSAATAHSCAAQLRDMGYGHVDVVAVDVVASGQGLEADARTARHAAFDQTATTWEQQWARPVEVLLGHTADDQAESVLLGLARGSGIRSLAGIAPTAGRLSRPLLSVRRADTERACRDLGLTAWADPHNDDPAFTRVRVRHTVLPMLEAELGPGIADALVRTADLARADADYLDELAASADVGNPPSCTTLARLPQPVRTRVLRGWLRAAGAREVNRANVDAVESLVIDWKGQGPVDLAGIRVARVRDRLEVVTR